jgi:hypothetical protein
MSKAPQKSSTDHSAVTIPAGSFDHAALASGLDAVAQAKPDDRAGAVSEALSAGSAAPIEAAPQHMTPGYSFKDIETEIAPGVVVTERVQVPAGEDTAAPPTELAAITPAPFTSMQPD